MFINLSWISLGILISLLVATALGAVGRERQNTVTTGKLVQKYGYPFEEHLVETSDGYILGLHRIPFSPKPKVNISSEEPRPVVFFMHGLLSSSSDWVLLGQDAALAFQLSDAGYDVWMGNARGNVYSRKHVSLNPRYKRFWNFEWHEIAMYDIPAMIEYICDLTGEKQITYFGHSQGTTTFLVLNSLDTEFKHRIKSAHLLAPVAFMKHLKSPILKWSSLVTGLPNYFPEFFGSMEFLPSSKMMELLGFTVCTESSPINNLCSNPLFLIAGFDSENLNEEMIVENHGYPFEEHSVQTSDGYVLTMHRIPYSGRVESSSEDEPRPVAFFMHGILCSSSDWVILGPDNALAYLLSDAGYDVWMGNARGNTYSREHVTLNPFFGKFWNFDWHEIGMYDLPAMIDYIRFFTGEDQVTYFGHSQGTTTFLLLNSLNERFKTRIRSAHLLAPVAYMENMESPIMDLTSLTLGGISKIPELFGNLEFMPSSAVMRILGQNSCSDSSPIQEICSNVLFLIAGHDAENLNTSDEDVLELDHLKHDEQPSTAADESVEGGDIHFEIPSVIAAEHPVAAVPASVAGAAEDTPINPTDLLPELEQQLEEMTTAKTSPINNAAAGQREGEQQQTPEGISHHRPPMLPHHDGGKVGSSQQQAPGQTGAAASGGANEESIGTVEGNINSPFLTKPFYGAARLAFGQNPEVPSTSTSKSTTSTSTTTTTVPTTIITSPTTNENIPESIITSPPSAQSIETSGVLPPATADDDDSNSSSKEHQVNPATTLSTSSMSSKNPDEHNNSNLSPPSASSSSMAANSNEKEQLGDTFIPQMEATKPGPERRSLNVMPLKTAENLLKHKDGQYSSFDMAQYVFWTGDEAGVARAVEEFIEQGLMSRENAIKFLRDIRLGIEYLQSSYANRVFPDQLRDNFIKKHSHNSNPMPTQAPATTTSTTTTTTTTTRRPIPLTTERTSSVIAREYSSAAAAGGAAGVGSGHKMVLNHHLDKTIESMPSLMRLQDANNVHHERERSEHDEAAGRAKIAKFLYTEFSLEEVIYQLGKVMFSESLAHGSDQAQQELQRLTDFLEEEGKQGMISPELQKKVLDVLLQALSDTLVERPELLAAARANLGSSFEKLPNNSLESKN